MTLGHMVQRARRHGLHWGAVTAILVGAGLFFLVFDLLAHEPGAAFFSGDPVDQRLVVNVLSRTSVAMISTLFACLFLAIPLTANMFTPQVITLFVGSPMNRTVLGLFVLSAAVCVWAAHVVGDGAIPAWHLGFAFSLVMLDFVLLLPFLFFVFRFLQPEAIIARVRDEIVAVMLSRSGRIAVKRKLSRWVHNLGNIVLGALDRADRDVAIAGVEALGGCAKRWLALKSRRGDGWFRVEAAHFPGFSNEAVNLVNRDRVWVEMEILGQLSRSFSAALDKTPDVISAISRTQRLFAAAAARRGDPGALDLALRFFNNYLREAIKRGNIHAAYDLLYQVRMTAVALWPFFPEKVVQMGRRLEYYAAMAQRTGMSFARDLVAYDFGHVVTAVARDRNEDARDEDANSEPGQGAGEERHRSASPADSEAFAGLLAGFLRLTEPPGGDGGSASAPGFYKVRLITAAELLALGREDAAQTIIERLRHMPEAHTRQSGELLLGPQDEFFWEVTDRQQNLDYVRPEIQSYLRQVMGALKRQAG